MKRGTSLGKWSSCCIAGSGRGSTIRWSRLLLWCLWLLGGLWLAGSPARAAEVKAGDILAVDGIAGTNGLGTLFLVNPTTGNRTVLSDFGNPAQGHLADGGGGGTLRSVVVGRGGKIFVTDLFSGTGGQGILFAVDPATGNRSVVSDFGQGALQGFFDYGLAVDASGKIVAHLEPSTANGTSAVVRVAPETDARVLVSDVANPAQGDLFTYIIDLALDHAGNILVNGRDLDQVHQWIFEINPDTGQRRILSDFKNPAQGADTFGNGFSNGLAVEASGQILVNVSVPGNLLVRIDPTTGSRTVLSDLDNPAQGPLGYNPWGIAVEKSGGIIVAVGDAATGSLSAMFILRVDPGTGRRAVVSDSGNAAQGPSFSALNGVAVVPEACAGDCSGMSSVAITDLITLVNIALGTAQASACPHGVPSGATVNITMIIQAVNNALNGCG